MNIAFPSRPFAIALLAQIVLCLVASPVWAAERWAASVSTNENRDAAPVIQSAFESPDVRPEEVCDAAQKRGKARSAEGRCNRICVDLTPTPLYSRVNAGVRGGFRKWHNSEHTPLPYCYPLNSAARKLDPPAFSHPAVYGGVIASVGAGLPAVQPTGPPTA